MSFLFFIFFLIFNSISIQSDIQPCIAPTQLSTDVSNLFYLLQPLPTSTTPCVILQLLGICPGEHSLTLTSRIQGILQYLIDFIPYQSGNWNQWIACLPIAPSSDAIENITLEVICNSIPGQTLVVAWNGLIDGPIATYQLLDSLLTLSIFQGPGWVVFPDIMNQDPIRFNGNTYTMIRRLLPLVNTSTYIQVLTDSTARFIIPIPKSIIIPSSIPIDEPPSVSSSLSSLPIPWLDYNGDELWIIIGALLHLIYAIGYIRQIWTRQPMWGIISQALWTSLQIPFLVLMHGRSSYLWSFVMAILGLCIYTISEGLFYFFTFGKNYVPIPSLDKLQAIKFGFIYLILNALLSLMAVTLLLEFNPESSC